MYLGHWTGSTLLRAMTCCLFGTRQVPEPLSTFCHLDPNKDIYGIHKWNYNNLLSWKWILKCRLQHDGSFVVVPCILSITLRDSAYETSTMINYTLLLALFPCHGELIWLFYIYYRPFPGKFCEDYNNKVVMPFTFCTSHAIILPPWIRLWDCIRYSVFDSVANNGLSALQTSAITYHVFF